MPAVLDNCQRPPKKLLAPEVVRELVLTLKPA
jgi:hypothetical protein